MPTYQTAKQVAENALSTIGAFPASQSQADAGELSKALMWLEMILNSQAGVRPMAGFFRIVDIPVTADIGDYLLSDYDDAAGTQHVFSASLVGTSGEPQPLELMYENEAALEDLSDTGTPTRAVITKDAKPRMKLYPEPTQSNQDAGQVIRIRIQTYHDPIDPTGTADADLLLRPSWYLWIVKRLAYEIGSGPVRKIGSGEIDRLEKAADKLEKELLARDGKNNVSGPPVTEAYGGPAITYHDKDEVNYGQYSNNNGYSNSNRNR